MWQKISYLSIWVDSTFTTTVVMLHSSMIRKDHESRRECECIKKWPDPGEYFKSDCRKTWKMINFSGRKRNKNIQHIKCSGFTSELMWIFHWTLRVVCPWSQSNLINPGVICKDECRKTSVSGYTGSFEIHLWTGFWLQLRSIRGGELTGKP